MRASRLATIAALVLMPSASATAQKYASTVNVTVVVPVVMHLTAVDAPRLVSRTDSVEEYTVTARVRANTAYVLTAGRADVRGGVLWVAGRDGTFRSLDGGAGAVVVGRGSQGASDVVLTYRIATRPGGGAPASFPLILSLTSAPERSTMPAVSSIATNDAP
jgi:hypothetical protein